MNNLCDGNIINIISYLENIDFLNFNMLNEYYYNWFIKYEYFLYKNLIYNNNFLIVEIDNNLIFENQNYKFTIEKPLLIINKNFFKTLLDNLNKSKKKKN